MTHKEQTLLTYLQEAFDEAVRLTKGSREEGRDAYEYMRGNQLPDDVKGVLALRGQPERWENIYMKIDNKVEGMKLMTRQEISAFPRRTEDREKARTITGTLRASMDSTEWWTNKKRADRDLRVVGLSVMESKLKILGETDIIGREMKEINYIHLPALECFIDMYANNADMSDQRYFHHSRLLYKPSLVKKFGSAALNLVEDKSGMARVQRSWYRDDSGDIRVAIWSEGILLEDKATPYTKIDRFPLSIRRLRWSHVKEYYGIYRDIRPFQDSINNTMLRLINMLGSSKLLVESDAVDDIDTFKDDYSLDNAVVTVRAGALGEKKMQDISQASNIAQLMSIVQDARQQAEMVIGLNSEVLGSAVNRMSGYAIENRQNAGLVGLQSYMDVSSECDKDLAEISIKIIEEHFTAEQIYAINDKRGERQEIVLSEYERDESGRIIYENGKPKQKSIIATGRYDVILNVSPWNRGATAERQKNWTEILKVMQVTNPPLASMLLAPMLRDVDSPEATEVQRIIEAQQAQAKEQGKAEQMQMQQMALQMQHLQAKIEEMESKANLNNAKAGELAQKDKSAQG